MIDTRVPDKPPDNTVVLQGQYQYDLDLAKSMREMADWVQNKSAKVAITLRQGADRIEKLSARVMQDAAIEPPIVQPASTPALQPVRD